MNPISNVGANDAVQKVVSNPIQKQTPANPPANLPATDKLELSGVSYMLKSLQSNDIRTDKVASIRAQLEAGTYEDDTKLNVATDRLLDDLSK
jgi:anti-sigma28 factor (negative regulator of flagellin synthesis)